MNKRGSNPHGGTESSAHAGTLAWLHRPGREAIRKEAFLLWLLHLPQPSLSHEKKRVVNETGQFYPVLHNSALQTFQEDAIQGESPNSGWKDFDLQKHSSISL